MKASANLDATVSTLQLRDSKLIKIHRVFEARLGAWSSRIAVEDAVSSISYAELSARSGVLAVTLSESIRSPEERVGIFMERSVDMIVAMLAVLKSGAAYVPIDVRYPPDRVQFMLSDAGCRIVLSEGRYAESLAGFSGQMLLVDNPDVFQAQRQRDRSEIAEGDLAYVIYTSGSTGTPKGVMVEHWGLLNLVEAHSETFRVPVGERMSQVASPAFDAAAFEIWPALLLGHTLVMCDEFVRMDPIALRAWIGTERIGFSYQPTVIAERLLSLPGNWGSLKTLVVAGEQMRSLLPTGCPVRLFNLYGPTETTIWVASYEITHTTERPIPIGRPIRGSRLTVLDKRGKLAPIGIAGELCIGGIPVARGYITEPSSAISRFTTDPFRESERMYRSGDIVRWRKDGNLEFLGRADEQIKIRGFRVELNEVKNAIRGIQGVDEAAVEIELVADREKRICGYYAGKLAPAALREALESKLPFYLIPSRLVALSVLPLTLSGKIDAKALASSMPQPEFDESDKPRDEIEAELFSIVRELLGVSDLKFTDSFFSLGGHSLSAVRLSAIVRKTFRVPIGVREIFSTPKLVDIAKLIRGGCRSISSETILRLPDKDSYPLTSQQRRLVAMQLASPESVSYNIPCSFVICGTVDPERMRSAFDVTIRAHAILRTLYDIGDSGLEQRIVETFEIPFSVEFSGSNPSGIKFVKPFDLTSELPIRGHLVKHNESSWTLQIDLHHVAVDGTCLGGLVTDLFDAYRNGHLRVETLRYADFAVWQASNRLKMSPSGPNAYWKRIFSQSVPDLELPLDYSRPKAPSERSDVISRAVPSSVVEGLREIARKSGATLHMVLLAIWKVLLARLADAEDIVVGIPSAGRAQPELASIVGMFVNTLPIRTHAGRDLTFSQFLGEVRQKVLDGLEYQDFDFEELAGGLSIRREPGRNPLFDTMFAYEEETFNGRMWQLGEATAQGTEQSVPPPKFDITVSIRESDEGLRTGILFASELFDRPTIDLFLERYLYIAYQIASGVDITIGNVSLIGDRERDLILRCFNDTSTVFPEAGSTHNLIEATVDRYPEAIALRFGNLSVSYRVLDERANQIAHILREKHGIRPDMLVGLCLERSIEMVVGILGIWKAGGAYVPIDPNDPPARIDFILDDSKIGVVLVKRGLPSGTAYRGSVIDVESLADYPNGSRRLENLGTSRNLAYAIYTSGSTGQPKGALIEHRSLVNNLTWMHHYCRFTAKDVILQKTSFTFDVSVWELILPLIVGCKEVLLEIAGERDPERIKRAIVENAVTAIHFVPSMLAAYLGALRDDAFAGIRICISSGEALSSDLRARFFLFSGLNTDLFDMYGPTEATIHATAWKATPKGRSLIGRPVANTGALILSEQGDLRPIGVPGELFLTGVQLARGYLDRDTLTLERFIDNPINAGERTYRTGDLARWTSTGELEYLGRLDHQVKIRGHRIELGEIEVSFRRISGIDECVVVAHSESDSTQTLAAYYTGEIIEENIRTALRQKLPSHMIPKWIIRLSKIPTTASGKVDRKALPSPAAEVRPVATLPSTEAEKCLMAAVFDLLANEVGLERSFYDVGGDSIKAIQIASYLRHRGWRLSIRSLASSESLRSCAATMERIGASSFKPEDESETRPIEALILQKRLLKGSGDWRQYNQSQTFSLNVDVDRNEIEKTLSILVSRHPQLRTVVKNGSMFIGSREKHWDGFQYIELSDLTDPTPHIRSFMARLQASFDFEGGGLFKAALFRCHNKCELFVVAHHLIIDFISWSVLVSEFEILYGVADSKMGLLGPVASSFAQWSSGIASLAGAGYFDGEFGYWKNLLKDGMSNVGDISTDAGTIATSETRDLELDAAITRKLFADGSSAYGLKPNEGILCALALAATEWTGAANILVEVETHGRQAPDLLPLELDGIIGWFTSIYPVCLTKSRGPLGDHVLSVKESLRAVPSGGIGFGALSASERGPFGEWKTKPSAPIVFNYFGQHNYDGNQCILRRSSLQSEDNRAPHTPLDHLLSINAVSIDGRLTITVTLDGARAQNLALDRFIAVFRDHLVGCALHFSQQCPRRRFSPSDFELQAEITQTELDAAEGEIAQASNVSGYSDFAGIRELTSLQEGILYAHLRDEATGAYVVQSSHAFDGELDQTVLEAAYRASVDRHLALRTRFVVPANLRPLQVFLKTGGYSWNYFDFRDRNSGVCIEELIEADRLRKFDLGKDSLFRLRLIRTEDRKWIILSTAHHIILDGWSVPIVLRELFLYYAAFRDGTTPKLQECVPFARHLDWLKRQDGNRLNAYWHKRLLGSEPNMLVTPHNNDGAPSEKHSAEVKLESGLCNRLIKLSKAVGISINSITLTAWCLAMRQVLGSREILVGNVTSGRSSEVEGIQNLVGMCVSTLPFRLAFLGSETLCELLKRVQNLTIEDQENSAIRLSELQTILGFGSSLIDHVYVFENYPQLNLGIFAELGLSLGETTASDPTEYGLDVAFRQVDEAIGFRLRWDASRCPGWLSIPRLIGYIERALECFAQNPESSVGEMALQSSVELKTLQGELRAPGTTPPSSNEFVHRLISRVSKSIPGRIAVYDPYLSLSYKELDEKSNSLARTLRVKHGVCVDEIVGLRIERSSQLIVAILAVLKAGGAYVPIESAHPISRQKYILKDTRASLLIVDRPLPGELAFDGTTVDLNLASNYSADDSELDSISNNRALAYVIYTSGTTGCPKGVLIEHRSLVNLVLAHERMIALPKQGRVLQCASISFDASVWEIFTTLARGLTLCIAPNNTLVEGSLAEFIRVQGICCATISPSLLAEMDATQFGSDVTIISAGEACSIGLALKWTHLCFFNAYGPTECTVCATIHRVTELRDKSRVPIGKTIENVNVTIVDFLGNLASVGAVGELCIGGEQLARGYLGLPDLTAASFVENPFRRGERMYRTGDLARWTEAGELDHVGRLDDQVKIRGFRIELSEVESVLRTLPKVINGAVIALKATSETTLSLRAYWTGTATMAEVEQHFRLHLPGHMIPEQMMQLEEMPLTISGKIDRNVLSNFERQIPMGIDLPQNELERRLAEVFTQVLGITVTSRSADFFELGGTSLKAIRVVAKLQKEWRLDLRVRDLLRTRTIKGLSELLIERNLIRFEPIEPHPGLKSYRATFAQRRMHALQEINGGTAYNIVGAYRLEGPLDVVRFQSAVISLVERHESLRMSFFLEEGELQLRVHPETDFSIRNEKGSKSPQEMLADLIQPFDLLTAPLMRMTLTAISPSEHILLLDIHHIISDGISIQILLRDLSLAYKGHPFATPPNRYSDYAYWQAKLERNESWRISEQYWLARLAGDLPVLNLPTDDPRPAFQTFTGSTVTLSLPTKLAADAKSLSLRTNCTLYSVFLAAFKVLLSKYTGQDDIIVGTATAGREHADVQEMVGLFVNSLAIRTSPNGKKRFIDYLSEVSDAVIEGIEHQQIPFEHIIEKTNPPRDPSRNAIFSVMFEFQRWEGHEALLGDVSLRPISFDTRTSKMDLTLRVRDLGDSFEIDLEFADTLYRRNTALRLCQYYNRVLRRIVEHPQQPIARISLLDTAERDNIIGSFNGKDVPYPNDRCLHQLFEDAVRRAPEADAVISARGRISFKRLNIWANRLGNRISSTISGDMRLVGVLVERSPEMMAAVLGILKCGAAYVPIDPNYPSDRIDYILSSSGCGVLLTTGGLRKSACGFLGQTIDIGGEYDQGEGVSNLETEVKPTDLAYVIYTSGSTGKPKGAMIEHRSIVNRLFWMQSEYSVGPKDVILQKTPYTFDVSVWEMFLGPITGAATYLLPVGAELEPNAIYDTIESSGITLIHFVPSMLSMFLQTIPHGLSFGSLRHCFSSGEALTVQQKDLFFSKVPKGVELHNLYGPTEAAVDVTYYRVNPCDDEIPIGRGVANTYLYVLDSELMPVPIGVIGQLCIGGVQVGRGYVNDPKLTQERFILNPFRSGESMYLSGDLARWRSDGLIEYLGRMDSQVKIRGFRIELGEVESAIRMCQKVESVVVAARSLNGNADSSLCAFWTGTASWEEVRMAACRALPSYMVPEAYLRLEEMPLTSSGKIDRKNLPCPSVPSGNTSEMATSGIETQIALLFAKVLGAESVGRNDSFFDLGGNSFKAMRLAAQLRKDLSVKVNVRDIFRSVTVAALARFLSDAEALKFESISRVEIQPTYKTSDSQSRMYALQELDQGCAYNMPSAFEIVGELEYGKLKDALVKLVDRHESLRTSFELVDGELRQVVAHSVKINLEEIPSRLDVDTIMSEFVKPFDLGVAPLFRVRLVRRPEGEQLLCVDIHHIIADGTSMDILLSDLRAAYSGRHLVAGQIQYKDATAWLRLNQAGEGWPVHREYWLGNLGDGLPILNLPTDFKRPPIQEFVGDKWVHDLDAETGRNVEGLCRKYGITPFMFHLAVFSVLLAKHSGQDDIVIGTPMGGRDHPELERVIGLFVNTVPIRLRPAEKKQFSEFLAEVKTSVVGALAHQAYPFDLMVRDAVAIRDLSRNPIFSAMFAFENRDTRESPEFPFKLNPLDIRFSPARLDLMFTAVQSAAGTTICFSYASSIFEKATIKIFSEHYEQLLKVIFGASPEAIQDLDMITGQERLKLLRTFNDTDIPYPEGTAIHKLFEQQAINTPDAVAVVHEDGILTYRQLNDRANELAWRLLAAGVQAEDLIPIVVERSPEMVIGLLAILKSGCAYVPIDSNYPDQRISYMLNDCGSRLIVVQRCLARKLAAEGLRTVYIEDVVARTEGFGNPPKLSTASDLAYVIYTSGSTGKPKGARIEHGGVVRLICGPSFFRLSAETVFLQFAPLSFDGAVYEIWAPLLHGGRVVLVPHRMPEIDELGRMIRRLGVNSMCLTTGLFQMLAETHIDDLRGVRQILAGGEVLSFSPGVRNILTLPDCRLINGYGPTECSALSCCHVVTMDDAARRTVPIGRPIANTTVLILDGNDRLVPTNIVGELCVAGVAVGRGYLNNDVFTESRFRQNPFRSGQRMYKTGDLARWLGDGTIEFVGRLDGQVKMRGFRIELGEIEETLRDSSLVLEATAILKDRSGTNRQLVAYVTPVPKVSADKEALDNLSENLQRYLRSRLPGHMVPSVIMILEELPKTLSGKVSVGELPDPSKERRKIEPPTNAGEAALIAAFKKVLNVGIIGTEDNFFMLGGDSLKALGLIAELKKNGFRLKFRDLFELQTVKEIAGKMLPEKRRK